MKYIKKYNVYKESIKFDLEYQEVYDLMESMNIWHDALLTSISAEELDIFDTLNLPREQYSDNLDLSYLTKNIEFINSLSSLGLKKSQVQSSDDFATFLNKPCKYMFVFKTDSNELQNPEYLLLQTWNDTLEKWEDVSLYKVNDIKKFYDKLTSKIIEIVDGDDSYIYQTSNGGIEWVLQNIEKANVIYQKVIRKDDFEKLLINRKVKVNII